MKAKQGFAVLSMERRREIASMGGKASGLLAPSITERIKARIEITPAGCWNWLGSIDRHGYGKLGRNNAHLTAYRAFRGPIPRGLVLDHLCRNRKCCNPDHLEVVTHRVNILRGEGPAAKAARREVCAHGHPYSPDNTYKSTSFRGRVCRTCNREAVRRYSARHSR